MDLLQENKKKNNKTPAQKLVLTLLIISIILCVVIGIIIAYFSIKGENKPYSITINGKVINNDTIKLVDMENGSKYISLKALCNQLVYNYYNGEFKIAEEDKTKGYIDNKINIVQFFAGSKEIYKTSENSNTDVEYYRLENAILFSEDNLFISIDDLDIALNLLVDYSEKDNQTTINTPEYHISKIEESFKKNNVLISNTPENLKALSYGYIIINKDDKYGVIDLTGEELIGNKYNDIVFSEYTGDFIVSDINNKYGIITNSGLAKVNLQYDSIEIINYKPLLYKIERLEKFGIMMEEGNILNEIIYDSIGYPENRAKEINYTLKIPNLNENIPESIIVGANNKYGLIDLETGEQVIDCTLDGIYSATEKETLYYIVEVDNKKMFLENYINNLNRITVNVD